jgi:uncharacterized protein YeaO (DUF488 family)
VKPQGLNELLDRAAVSVVTLVFSARDERYNQAVALREYLELRRTNGAD